MPQMGLYLLPLATVSPAVRLGRAPGRAGLGNVHTNQFLEPSGLQSACLLGQCRAFLPGA